MTSETKPPLVWCILQNCGHRYEKDYSRCPCPCHKKSVEKIVKAMEKTRLECSCKERES